MINKYEIHFIDPEHIAHFDSIAARWIIEPKYMDVDLLRSPRLWDSLHELLEVAGWVMFIMLDKPVYECLYWEFLSSLMWIRIPLTKTNLYISNFNFSKANLAKLDCRMHLPHGRVSTICHKNFNVEEFGCEITCDKRTPAVNNHGSHVGNYLQS